MRLWPLEAKKRVLNRLYGLSAFENNPIADVQNHRPQRVKTLEHCLGRILVGARYENAANRLVNPHARLL